MTIDLNPTLSSIRRAHRTDRYTTRSLIVRRGESFSLVSTGAVWTVTLVRARLYANSSPFEHSLGYTFKLPADAPTERWTVSRAPNSDRAEIYVPPDAKVGLYTLSDGDSTVTLVVLFNPFCPDDMVYLSDSTSVDEHVLSDVGYIWRGTSDAARGTQWNYSQFRTAVLLSALHLLDSMPVELRGDAVRVSRHLSAVANASDADGGVLVGNWSGDYAGGVSPLAWTGSADILQRYWSTGSAVRYAQCWVFAGVLTSLLRTLGIPATTVSNFSSAHESTRPYNRIVEHFYSRDGKPLPDRHMGSVWNFHVWTHAWMARPDLRGYAQNARLSLDGWQAVDATPQERSMGLFQLGPAPVQAIKYGYEFDYDCDFVISEVNADVVHFWQDSDGKFRAVQSFPRAIGRAISVKKPGSTDRMDITSWYKFPEGSAEERKSFQNRPSEHSLVGLDRSTDVKFTVTGSPSVRIGDEITVDISMVSQVSHPVHVLVHARCAVTNYTGRELDTIWHQIDRKQVGGGATVTSAFYVRPGEYLHTLAGGAQSAAFDLSAVIEESEQPWSHEHIVLLSRDDMLQVSVPGSAVVGKASRAEVVVLNHTDLTLTACTLRVEGPGLTAVQTVEVGKLGANLTASRTVQFTPSEVGARALVVTLDSNELDDVVRSVNVDVGNADGTRDLDAARWDGADDGNITAVISHGSVTTTGGSGAANTSSRSCSCCG